MPSTYVLEDVVAVVAVPVIVEAGIQIPPAEERPSVAEVDEALILNRPRTGVVEHRAERGGRHRLVARAKQPLEGEIPHRQLAEELADLVAVGILRESVVGVRSVELLEEEATFALAVVGRCRQQQFGVAECLPECDPASPRVEACGRCPTDSGR